MPRVVKTCRVCGKAYEACPTDRHKIGVTFRWQDVACSPECGAVYLEQVNTARGITTVISDNVPEIVPEEVQEEVTKKSRKRSKKAADPVIEDLGEHTVSDESQSEESENE